jgi:hypothetical protein
MAFKKIIHNAFEQVIESGKDMAKSSVKQVTETLSPWDMIRNSFTDTEGQSSHSSQKSKEGSRKGEKHTPLDFDNLDKKYASQDKQKLDSMKLRLFQMVKRDDERSLQQSKQSKAEKERSQAYEEADKKRREEQRRRSLMQGDAPEGKSGRGTALMGKKKKKQASEPQPAETKPGGGKF